MSQVDKDLSVCMFKNKAGLGWESVINIDYDGGVCIHEYMSQER